MHNLKTYRVFGNERYKSVCLLHRLEMYFWQCCNELLIQEESRQIDSYCEATTATGNPRIFLWWISSVIFFIFNIKLYKLLFNWKVNRKHHLFSQHTLYEYKLGEFVNCHQFIFDLCKSFYLLSMGTICFSTYLRHSN